MGIVLPTPPSKAKAIDDNVVTLFRAVDDLERKLRDKMRERDRLLRDTRGRLSRAKLGSDIRLLDDHVSELRRELAVRQLELEMERIHMALENEFREFSESTGRSDQEGEILLAEFALIDSKLGELVEAVVQDGAESILDQDLYTLASEIPDLSSRLGVEDQGPQVYKNSI